MYNALASYKALKLIIKSRENRYISIYKLVYPYIKYGSHLKSPYKVTNSSFDINTSLDINIFLELMKALYFHIFLYTYLPKK